jgi:CheY-like chemotaxis protein
VRTAGSREKSTRRGGQEERHAFPRFLIADDNDADVHWLKMVLDEAGICCTLSVVSDGEQARDFLLRHGGYASSAGLDLIFLDLNLPKLSGIEVLRQVPGSNTMPFCIASLRSDESLIWVKPVDRMKILNCFRCYAHLRPFAEALSA